MAAMSVFGSIQFFGVGDAQIHRKFGHDTRGGICMQPPTHGKIVEKFIQKIGKF